MKYRVFALMGLLAMSAGVLIQAQDYDDIYYDASKSQKTAKTNKTVVVAAPAKTEVIYGDVPQQYKDAVKVNYSTDRDVDEYNRRGSFEPEYEISITGDTIFEDAFANTRRIERFYNPDVVILSDDDDLVELYYDESPSINLIVGSDWGYGSYGWADSYYPWYSWGAYYPWRSGWYDPWYSWYSPWYYSWHWRSPALWGWNYWGPRPWHHAYYGWGDWRWGGPGIRHHWNDRPARYGHGGSNAWRNPGTRVGLANNRNGRGRVNTTPGTNRNGITARGGDVTRSTGVGGTTRGRAGYGTTRSGNIGSRGTSGVTTRSSGVSRGTSGVHSYSGGNSSYGGSRSSNSGSYSGGSRSSNSGSYSGGSRSGSSGSYSGGGSRGGGGSYGGGSRGGSSGGGGRRR